MSTATARPAIKNLSDEELVTLAKQGTDTRYFGEIYKRYHKKVLHSCVSYTKDMDAAADLAQDVMVKIYENLANLQHARLLGWWIYRITTNYCLDYCKTKGRHQFVDTDHHFDLVDDQPQTQEDRLSKEQQLEGIERLMFELGDETRDILLLKYYSNYSVKDLQEKFNLSESAVKMRLARARNRIEQLYKRESVAA